MSDPWARPDPADERHSTDGDTDRPRVSANGARERDADPELARTFGRPSGVDGAFARNGSHRGGQATQTARPAPPAPALAAAFGRPEQGDETLQRPERRPDDTGTGDVWWSRDADRDPWRDPDSAPRLGVAERGPARRDPASRRASSCWAGGWRPPRWPCSPRSR